MIRYVDLPENTIANDYADEQKRERPMGRQEFDVDDEPAESEFHKLRREINRLNNEMLQEMAVMVIEDDVPPKPDEAKDP